MIVLYVIISIFVILFSMTLLSEIYNKFEYNKEMRKLKLDRYRKSTEEMMKPSLSKAILGYRPYLNKLKEEDEEEEDEDGMEESNN